LIGVDIVYIPRFRRAIMGTYAERLLNRIYSEAELLQCSEKNEVSRLQSLAGRFAIKEAVIKASKGELTISDLKAIEVRQASSGYLEVFISRKDLSCIFYEVSMSHDGDYAVGIAMKAKNGTNFANLYNSMQ